MSSRADVVLVCGSRGWIDREAIRQELSTLPTGTIVVHGGARGADRLAGEVAVELGLKVRAIPPDWARYGRAAGLVRNRQMIETERPARVIAFVRDAATSPGSMFTVELARRGGIPTKVVIDRLQK